MSAIKQITRTTAVACATCLFLVNGALAGGSGTVTNQFDTVTWTGGPYTSAAVDPTTCTSDVTCDKFTLTINIPPSHEAAVRFRIDWVDPTNDFDLYIYDSLGTQVGSSGAATTEFEEVAINGLGPGNYEVVALAFATAGAEIQGEAELLSIVDNTGDDPPLALDNTIRFRNTIVDFSAGSGEPFINSDNEGNSFASVPFGFSTTHSLLWKSIDNERSFIALGSPVTRDAVAGLGGGDTHQDFDHAGNFYYVDLSAICVTAAVSTDGGNTFDPLRNNQVTCISEENPQAAGDDRQWAGAFGDGIGYATWRNLLGGSFWLFRTEDGGLNWDKGQLLGTVSQSGPLRVDKTLRDVGGQDAIISYQVYHTGSTVRVFRIEDINGAITVHDRLVAPGPGSKGNVFPVISIDTAGNLYVVYSQGANQIYLVTSTDRGDTWSAPKPIGNTFGTNIMPWIIAGDPGRVAIAWYNSNLDGNPNVPSSVWNIYMAQTLNALDPSPTITYHKANHTVIHYAQICLNGLGCNLSVPMGDRGFLEFPSITMDENGAAVLVYNDNTNQPHHVYVMVAKQLDGPSLFASVGDLSSGAVDPGTVTLDTPLDGTEVTTSDLDADGTHTLPALNFDRDEAADALFPDHGAVIGPNFPAMDINCVTIEGDGPNIKVTMELDDLTLASLATAPDALFLTQWDYNDNVYWVAAEVHAGVPVYHTGGLAVVTSGTSTKYMTYNPNAIDSASVVGSVDMSAPGTVTLSIPRSLVGNPIDGDTLHHVTGYAMAQSVPLAPVSSGDPGEPGVPNPSSFPIKVDASGGFSHTLGDPLMQDGIVELSIDDAPFASPVLADTLGACNADWTANVDVSGLGGGTHTLCARQVVNGLGPSPADCVTFTIPDPDTDGDGITDSNDNCVFTPNADQLDQDADTVGDVCDNCLLDANPDQCNTNGNGNNPGEDNFGNVCDADLNDDNIVNSFDLQIMRTNFGATGENDADLTCDGIVNSFDLQIMRQRFGLPPGPTGITP